MRTRLPILALAALLAAGCHDAEYTWSGSVSVEFGTGYVYYESSGWYYESVNPNLVVTVALTEHQDADVYDVWWTPRSWPVAPPTMSSPYSTTTTITFPASGTYQFDFHVRYWVGETLFEDVHRMEVVVLPGGVG